MIRGGPRSRAVSAGAGSFYEVSRATASSIGQPARGMPSNFMLSENRIPGHSGRPPLTPLPGARLPAGNIPDTAAHQVSPRIRLLTRYHPGYGCSPGITPDTAAHQVSPRIRLLTRYRPGYGFPPGIATHGPRPQGATRSRNMDCVMLFPPFGISLPQHAFLVTGMCEACGTTWRTQEV